VYAAEDAAASGDSPLALAASYEGLNMAATILNGNSRNQIPQHSSVAFTVPPLAFVGLGKRGTGEQDTFISRLRATPRFRAAVPVASLAPAKGVTPHERETLETH
jgi:pyruvate/2-oxoglutarate dehydrogenase complex dihydrolipoamide dehydrogenase (E3) component